MSCGVNSRGNVPATACSLGGVEVSELRFRVAGFKRPTRVGTRETGGSCFGQCDQWLDSSGPLASKNAFEKALSCQTHLPGPVSILFEFPSLISFPFFQSFGKRHQCDVSHFISRLTHSHVYRHVRKVILRDRRLIPDILTHGSPIPSNINAICFGVAVPWV